MGQGERLFLSLNLKNEVAYRIRELLPWLYPQA